MENLLNAGDLKAEALVWTVGLAMLGILLAAILRDMVSGWDGMFNQSLTYVQPEAVLRDCEA